MRVDVPYLFSMNCLARRKNLATSQDVGSFSKFVNLDKLCIHIYCWIHVSMDAFNLIEGEH